MIFFKTKKTSKQGNKQNHKTALQGSISFFLFTTQKIKSTFHLFFCLIIFSFSSPSTFYIFSDQENSKNERRKKKRKRTKRRQTSKNEKKLNLSRSSYHILHPLECKWLQWALCPLILKQGMENYYMTQYILSARWPRSTGMGISQKHNGLKSPGCSVQVRPA